MDSTGTCSHRGRVAVGARNAVPAVRDWCLRLACLALLALTVAQPGAAQDARKVIKDKAEYNTYVKALAMPDPGERAAALEAFLVQYPTSVAVADALTAALEAYQQAGNSDGLTHTAHRLLAIDSTNVRALAIAAFMARRRILEVTDSAATAQAAESASVLGHRCLDGVTHWAKPQDTPDTAFARLGRQMSDICYGAVAFAALEGRDYAGARDNYLKAVAINPANVGDTYQLGIAELESTPSDPTGFWYLAKAVNLAGDNAATLDVIERYAKEKYRRYHGSEDGWDALVADAKAEAAPPPNFASSIKRGP